MIYDKYIKLAKEASSVGDRIQAEYYHQFADHYSRIISENGIKSFDYKNKSKDSNKESLEDSSSENGQETSKSTTDQKIESSVKLDTKDNDDNDENINTLETVSFISQPAKKTVKLKK